MGVNRESTHKTKWPWGSLKQLPLKGLSYVKVRQRKYMKSKKGEDTEWAKSPKQSSQQDGPSTKPSLMELHRPPNADLLF